MKTKRLSYVFILLILTLSSGFKGDENPEKPNILFIEVDDLTAKYLGCFGASFAITPNIDRLAAEGVVFDNAVCQGAMCGPSRNSLITGLYPHNLGFYENNQIDALPRDVWTFPKELQENGYETFWVGKCHIKPNFQGIKADTRSERKDLAMKQQMGFDHVYQSAGRVVALRTAKKVRDAGVDWNYGQDAYADFLYDNELIDQFLEENGEQPSRLDPDTAYMDGHFTTKAIHNLANYQEDKPFFLWLNYSCPHGPFDVAPTYQAKFEASRMPQVISEASEDFELPSGLKPHINKMNERETAKMRASYSATIHYMDEQAGRVIDFIRNSKFADNTVIVFFSDQGIMTGEHGLLNKSTLFKEILNPALIIWYPEHFQPKRIETAVELLDLAKTVIDLSSAGPESLADCPNGYSLMPLLTEDGEYLRSGAAFSEIEGFRSVFDGRYKYIDNAAFPILFDLEKNPEETQNLAEELPETVAGLKKQHDDWIRTSGPIQAPGNL